VHQASRAPPVYPTATQILDPISMNIMRTIRMQVCICVGEIALRHGCIYSHADIKICSIDLSEFRIGKIFFYVCRFSSICVRLSLKRISNQFYLHGKNFSKIAPRRYNTCMFFFPKMRRRLIFLIFRIFLCESR